MRFLNREQKNEKNVPLMSNSKFLRKHREIYLSDSCERKEKDQTKMSEFVTKKGKYSNSDPRQIQLTNALLKFIAGNLLPLSVVESEEFKNLMEIAESKYQMPSREHLSAN